MDGFIYQIIYPPFLTSRVISREGGWVVKSSPPPPHRFTERFETHSTEGHDEDLYLDLSTYLSINRSIYLSKFRSICLGIIYSSPSRQGLCWGALSTYLIYYLSYLSRPTFLPILSIYVHALSRSIYLPIYLTIYLGIIYSSPPSQGARWGALSIYLPFYLSYPSMYIII